MIFKRKYTPFNELVAKDKPDTICGVIKNIENLDGMMAIHMDTHFGIPLVPPLPFYKNIENPKELEGWNAEYQYTIVGLFRWKFSHKFTCYRYLIGDNGVETEKRIYKSKIIMIDAYKSSAYSRYGKVLEKFKKERESHSF